MTTPDPIILIPWTDDSMTVLDFNKAKVNGKLAAEILAEHDRYRQTLEFYAKHKYDCPMFNPSEHDRQNMWFCGCDARVALEALGLPTHL